MKNNALAATSQALGIISQVLAIGIEVGLIAGGVYAVKKIKREFQKEPEVMVEVPEGMKLVPIEEENNTTLKEKWNKAKKIVKAVIG